MSMTGGPIAINQMAIHAAMDLFQIDNREECFDKVLNVYRTIIKEENAKLGAGKKQRG